MISLPLKQMTQAEKLMALEAIGDDLSRNEEAFESPAWHKVTDKTPRPLKGPSVHPTDKLLHRTFTYLSNAFIVSSRQYLM